MKCSVVILNWNGLPMLEQYMPSVLRYSLSADCEVVVADNGSTDGSLSYLRSLPNVRVLSFSENYGFAEGYNRALEEVSSEYCVLLNSDVEVTEGWLDVLLRYMDSHQAVVACQPKILSYRSKQSYDNGQADAIRFEHAGAAGGYIDLLGYPYCRGRMIGYTEEDRGQYDETVPIFWASGACLCIRTAVYKEAGGLDGRFFAHQEEIDLCWRLQSRGYEIVCVPQSVVYHLGGGSLDYSNPRKTYLNYRNNLLMLYKNMPCRYLWWVLIVRFFMDYASSLVFIVKGELSNFRAVVKARWSVLRECRQYKSERRENMQKAVVMLPELMAHRSIVWDYYFRGLRK